VVRLREEVVHRRHQEEETLALVPGQLVEDPRADDLSLQLGPEGIAALRRLGATRAVFRQ
jgi:hypothetical protein